MNARNATLETLLGPRGPQVSCEECFERLDEYVELEMGGADATGGADVTGGADADVRVPGMRAHLEGCPACREDHESLRALLSR